MRARPFIVSGLVTNMLGLYYGIVTTIAYGSNTLPETTIEAITDLTSMVMVLTGVVLSTIGLSLTKKKG